MDNPIKFNLTTSYITYAEDGSPTPPLNSKPEKKNDTIQSDKVQVTNSKKGINPTSVFEGIPSADNVEESKALFEQRKKAVTEKMSKEPMLAWKRETAGSNLQVRALAKLEAGVDKERINEVFLSGKPYAKPGTDFSFIRKGDYDFSLTSTIPVLFENLKNPDLKGDTKYHIMRNLLNEEGGEHLPSRWLLGIVPETENHILMTESARYLKNQLVQKYGLSFSTDNLKPKEYNNKLNGFNEWFVDHLSQFTRKDFDEYNSKPYQKHTVRAIQNLYEYGEDPQVKKSAQIVLDYMSARFATQSSELRRVVPYRRRQNYHTDGNLFEKDGMSSRYAMLAGNFKGFQNNTTNKDPFMSGYMITDAVQSYRIPDAILDLMINKGNNPYFMKARHENTEIMYAEKNFAISAGGHHHDWSWMPFSKQENGSTMPTVIMFKDMGPDLRSMIKFHGRGDNDKINNTGVYENFAFGIRPEFPADMEKKLKEEGKFIQKGNWKFAQIDDTYVAMNIQSRKSPDNYAPSVGFSEVVDKKEFSSLNDFISKVETNNNKQLNYYGRNTYTTTRGKTIEFEMAEPLNKNIFGKSVPPDTDEVTQWAVKKVFENGKQIPLETNLEKWKLMDSYTMNKEDDGENNDYVVKADGTGQVIINNPKRDQSLLMSLADHNNPIRIEQSGEAVNLAETSEVTRNNIKNGFELTVDLKEPEKTGYLSMKWKKGSEPSHVDVYVLKKGSNNWESAEKRSDPFRSKDYDFRTDFDLSGSSEIKSLKFMVTGKKLNLEGKPEVYKSW